MLPRAMHRVGESKAPLARASSPPFLCVLRHCVASSAGTRLFAELELPPQTTPYDERERDHPAAESWLTAGSPSVGFQQLHDAGSAWRSPGSEAEEVSRVAGGR